MSQSQTKIKSSSENYGEDFDSKVAGSTPIRAEYREDSVSSSVTHRSMDRESVIFESRQNPMYDIQSVNISSVPNPQLEIMERTLNYLVDKMESNSRESAQARRESAEGQRELAQQFTTLEHRLERRISIIDEKLETRSGSSSHRSRGSRVAKDESKVSPFSVPKSVGEISLQDEEILFNDVQFDEGNIVNTGYVTVDSQIRISGDARRLPIDSGNRRFLSPRSAGQDPVERYIEHKDPGD